MEIALGIKPHSGWAVAVTVTGDATAPVVLDRARLVLCPDELPRQIYHRAEALPAGEAARVVADVEDAVDLTTAAVLRDLVDRAGAHGTVVAAGIVGEPRDVPPLEKVLASHALLHLAEGELYRSALDEAATEQGLLVGMIAAKHAIDDAAVALGVGGPQLAQRLASLRTDLGPPWQADHKEAAAAALVALAAASAARSARRGPPKR